MPAQPHEVQPRGYYRRFLSGPHGSNHALGDSFVAPKTVPRYAKDAAAFPIWAVEPKLDERKRLGFSVLIFLIVYALLLVVAKKKTCLRTEAHVSLDAP
ncbi:MAG: hypothetical protein CR217_05045 [Beijerinckiaceae bacterium]|nr:MAG: hypothetical protein CR217_05045 [Beijerinckiaceae bacterium]